MWLLKPQPDLPLVTWHHIRGRLLRGGRKEEGKKGGSLCLAGPDDRQQTRVVLYLAILLEQKVQSGTDVDPRENKIK